MKYVVGEPYKFVFVDGHAERAIYLGKNKQGMLRFSLPGDAVWTGHAAPIAGKW